jgi:hypothetical protein
VLLLADSLAGLIWRADLPTGGGQATARVWLQHDSMVPAADSAQVLGMVPHQPGVNGVRYAARTGYLYYTSTGQKLFMRVPVHPATLEPAGDPEFVAGGTMADDFRLDEDADVAYVTTHRENTLDRVPLVPSGTRHIVAGEPFSDQFVGPSSAVWGRNPGDYGRIAYVTTDGGLVAPPADGHRPPPQATASSTAHRRGVTPRTSATTGRVRNPHVAGAGQPRPSPDHPPLLIRTAYGRQLARWRPCPRSGHTWRQDHGTSQLPTYAVGPLLSSRRRSIIAAWPSKLAGAPHRTRKRPMPW